MKNLATLGPVVLSAILIAWTTSVRNYSHYGSWHVYPALAILPLVSIWHLTLIGLRKPRAPFIWYGIAHCGILIPIWIGCLMVLSKDSDTDPRSAATSGGNAGMTPASLCLMLPLFWAPAPALSHSLGPQATVDSTRLSVPDCETAHAVRRGDRAHDGANRCK